MVESKLETCTPSTDTQVPEHYQQSVEPDALARGFDVEEFALARDAEQPIFRLKVPPAASLVTCGLFVGKPIFAREPSRIANAASVMPRVRTYATRGNEELVLEVASLRHASASSSVFSCSQRATAPYMVEGLWLGCWAASGVRVVAATELVTLQGNLVPQSLPPVSGCISASEETAGRLCRLEAELGVCSETACIPGSVDAGSSEAVGRCTPDTLGRRCILAQSPGFGRCGGGRCGELESQGEVPADQLVIGCTAETDGFSCRQVEVGTFGTCLGGRCRRRCSSADPEPASGSVDPNRAEAAASECMPGNVQFVGELANEIRCSFDATRLPIGVCVRPLEAP